MSLVAQVQNGQVVESASQSSLSSAASISNDAMNKDAFLQLLVAQMKYQDPLQPTSNTEYISQYAQFSQVEQMQNMAASMDLQRASSLVGEYVFVNTTNAAGVTTEVEGKVDYVVYENNKAYLAIKEQLYSLDDLVSVADATYIEAYNKAFNFVAQINQLPNVNGIEYTDISDIEDIEELEAIYEGMTDYEKSFVASDIVKILNQYTDKVEELKQEAEQAKKAAEAEKAGNQTGTEKTEGTDGSGVTES